MHVVFFGDSFSAGSTRSKLLDLSDHAVFAEDMQTTSDYGLLNVVKTDEAVLYLVFLDFL